jgi:phosphotransferase system HPr (HPr) family protein
MSEPDESLAGLRRRAILVNAAGLHARPCHAIVSLALEYACELRISLDGREVDARSILELMTLCAPQGSELLLRAEGEGASELLDRVEAWIAAGFDESN